MARTKEDTINEVTCAYLAQLDIKNLPSPENIKADILDQMKSAFDLENTVKEKAEKWKIMDRLIPVQVAAITTTLYPVILLDMTNGAGKGSNANTSPLAIYQYDGENEGIYVGDEETLENIGNQYCYGMNAYEQREYFRHLRRLAPRKQRCNNRDLVPVNNGIFDYKTKRLMPFSPEYVFTSKSRVNYNPLAKNVTIHNPEDGTDWDVESWMADLSDDHEIVNVLWQIMGAIIRPNVSWNKSAWFYSESGNNGKGSLCALYRAVCGNETCVSIPLSDFSQEFKLEPLLNASAIIVDENDVGTYIDKAANLKSVVTGDVLAINRKHQSVISVQFKGFMVQCLNEMPKVKDKSDSFYRRQLFIPFTKCFTGVERKYIKDDYIHRKDVLEYVVYKVLNMNYYELDNPKACQKALTEYRDFNDPVRQFMSEIMEQLVWDAVLFSSYTTSTELGILNILA